MNNVCPKCGSGNVDVIEEYLVITYFSIRSLYQCNQCMKVFVTERNIK